MNAVQELLRTLGAISIEEGLYIVAFTIGILVALYPYSKKRLRRLYGYVSKQRWRRNLDRMGNTPGMRDVTPQKMVANSAQKNGSKIPPPRRSGVKSPEEAISHEIRLRQTIARLQDQSSLEPMATFDTLRLKQEVIKPLREFLSELENIKMAGTAIDCQCHLRMEGRTRDGRTWTGLSVKEMPVELVNSKVDGFLQMKVSDSREQVSVMIEFGGWFVGDSDGCWKVSGGNRGYGFGKEEKYEVPMYDWYQLKEKISKLANDFLEGIADRYERG